MTHDEFPFRCFEPQADYKVVERKLPHWSQIGTICFITFRTNDSIPKDVLELWTRQREDWLKRHGINPHFDSWRQQLRELDRRVQVEFFREFSDQWHKHLDACHGECVLRQPELAEIVAQSLRHFDDNRYDLTDYVVMPNHVHVLAAFPDEDAMLAQCESWKHFTATQINRRLQRSGRFWQRDGFDHLVRTADQIEALRRYITRNPGNARLRDGEFLHESKSLGQSRERVNVAASLPRCGAKSDDSQPQTCVVTSACRRCINEVGQT